MFLVIHINKVNKDLCKSKDVSLLSAFCYSLSSSDANKYMFYKTLEVDKERRA